MSDFRFRDLPINEIKNPETGRNRNTNNVNFGLIANMAIIVKMIVSGSLTISSNIDKKECCISNTSDVMRAIVSPFLFSE